MLRYFAKCAKRVPVTVPKSPTSPISLRQRNGIGGEASVNVAIGAETSVTVAVVDSQRTINATRPQFGATLPPQRLHHDYTVGNNINSRFLTRL